MDGSATAASMTLFNTTHLPHMLLSPKCLWKAQPDLEINLDSSDMTHFQVSQEKTFRKRNKKHLPWYKACRTQVIWGIFVVVVDLFCCCLNSEGVYIVKIKYHSFLKWCGGPWGIEKEGLHLAGTSRFLPQFYWLIEWLWSNHLLHCMLLRMSIF